MISVRAHDLLHTFLDLEALDLVPRLSGDSWSAPMPNPTRKKANGLPLYSILVDIWADNVSGNRSKSWNKHWNIYMTNRLLPRELLQQEYNVHFVSTSPHATIAEQMGAVKKKIM